MEEFSVKRLLIPFLALIVLMLSGCFLDDDDDDRVRAPAPDRKSVV